jgi:glutamate carboxypeptidase
MMAGNAVILHMLAILKAMNFQQYGTLTVLINATRKLAGSLANFKLLAEHDATFSSSSRSRVGRLSLATSGSFHHTTIKGRASHPARHQTRVSTRFTSSPIRSNPRFLDPQWDLK